MGCAQFVVDPREDFEGFSTIELPLLLASSVRSALGKRTAQSAAFLVVAGAPPAIQVGQPLSVQVAMQMDPVISLTAAALEPAFQEQNAW